MIETPEFKILKTLRKGEAILSDIARTAGISTSTAHEYLLDMLKKGILARKEIGKSHVYSINHESFLARHMKILLSLEEINNSGLIEEIRKTNPSVMSIVLYGSVARGDDNEESDLDILVIARKHEKIAGLKSTAKIKRAISIEQYTNFEWKKKSKEDSIFYEKIIVDGIPLLAEIPVM